MGDSYRSLPLFRTQHRHACFKYWDVEYEEVGSAYLPDIHRTLCCVANCVTISSGDAGYHKNYIFGALCHHWGWASDPMAKGKTDLNVQAAAGRVEGSVFHATR